MSQCLMNLSGIFTSRLTLGRSDGIKRRKTHGCCGADCHNPEIKSIQANKAVKLRVSPPWSVCLALQLKDGQQHWSLLTGICVGVSTFFFQERGTFFPFLFHVRMCVLVVDLTYVWCLHVFACFYHCVMRE